MPVSVSREALCLRGEPRLFAALSEDQQDCGDSNVLNQSFVPLHAHTWRLPLKDVA